MAGRFHPYLLAAETRGQSSIDTSKVWEKIDPQLEAQALPALPTPDPAQVTFHFVVYSPTSVIPTDEQLRLKLWSNGTCQTNHSEAHGSWKTINNSQIEIEWHWRCLTPLKKQRFHSIPNTNVWEPVDIDNVQWKSLLIPVQCFAKT